MRLLLVEDQTMAADYIARGCGRTTLWSMSRTMAWTVYTFC